MNSPDNAVRLNGSVGSLSPGIFLSAFAIENQSQLSWKIRSYRLTRLDGRQASHSERGEAKGAMFQLRNQYRSRCKGYGFVIDHGADLIAVPDNWDLPSGVEIGAYRVELDCAFTAQATEVNNRQLIAGILRESIKQKLKNVSNSPLGPFWQHFDRFSQYPDLRADTAYVFCREFSFSPKTFAAGLWGVGFSVGTITLDGRSIQAYYRDGKVTALAQSIQAKQENRQTRKSRLFAVHALRISPRSDVPPALLELADVGSILAHSSLSQDEQKARHKEPIRVKEYSGKVYDVPGDQLRLILDTQLTLGDHRETIISPDERFRMLRALRDIVDGADLFGVPLSLSKAPISGREIKNTVIAPPSITVRGEHGRPKIIPAPEATPQAIRDRARLRDRCVRENGFLVTRAIRPLLAWPLSLGGNVRARAERMRTDLNHLVKFDGLSFRFDYHLYRDAEDLRRFVESSPYDALLAVLPEGSYSHQSRDDFHEQIKRKIELPSQCIQHNNTLPEKWATLPHREFIKSESSLARRIRDRYQLCVLNLLVKHHWLPFIPNSPFHFNVQVGIDVGGQHNTDAVACIGYGFKHPSNGLIFLPGRIPISAQQAEPIPSDELARGLLGLFERLEHELVEAGQSADFNSAIFYRDGRLLGAGDEWNEMEGLRKLFGELRQRNWVNDSAVWVVVEVMKEAEGLRVFSLSGSQVDNPIVGQCLMPFDEKNQALVCTTGRPYLRQGTTAPLKVKATPIHGQMNFDDVLQDFVWQADLGFTKPDMSLGLPWVLYVADSGALQLANAYRISGITV